jgi:acetyl-CoA carboxylase biotin carboxylase subunit
MALPRKVLVANRGEIAIRVIRTCRELGIVPVAVYSEADRAALHVRLADEAYPIGPPKASESYLDIGKLLGVAHAARCDAVHPGYGFLSENPAFAEAVEAAGLAFVGPSPTAMRLFGNKIAARKEAAAAGVPVVPGGTEPVADSNDLRRRAAELGLPVIIKAAAGGGGKGIRIVREPSELESAFALASSEAGSAFGNRDVFIERFIENARHIEVQLLGDGQGGVIHLGERECSLQRRQQKLVEECPSPSISPALREAILSAATALGRRIRYRSAGTVEFLVEGANGPDPRFYFMEMNTRLQVEHPVTEMVTGLDLVEEQLRIAGGEGLRWRQEDIRPRGHAIEARINAEDPTRGFVPSAGTIEALVLPAGPATRVDTALYVGDRVSLYYDPLVAKLVVWGRERKDAVARLERALDEILIDGIATSTPLLRRLVRDADFRRADFHIHFLEPFARRAMAPAAVDPDRAEAAAIAAAIRYARRLGEHSLPPASAATRDPSGDGQSPWVRFGRAVQLGGFER